ncbi:transcription initiation factor TFIID subunit 4-like [Falco rusticolus]|uniref:transcription initiation factor TFIID subunit 4-like n=1 Tax=Falco rusticolus TaxID=120794 RepID=UPI0018867D56|nr:transcription initiation factor TFIID subunit 4-like [Falco rusticolus]
MIRIFPDFSVQVTAAAAGGAAGGVPAAPGMGRAGAAANGNPQNVQGITSYQQRRGDRFAGRERHVVLSRHPPPPSSSSTPPAPPAALPAPWYRRRGTRGRAAAIPPAAAHVHNGRTCAARGGRQLPPRQPGLRGWPGPLRAKLRRPACLLRSETLRALVRGRRPAAKLPGASLTSSPPALPCGSHARSPPHPRKKKPHPKLLERLPKRFL